MLVALGVDYSIFLMMRYRGDAGAIPDVRRRILNSATIIGTVVISAAIILGGTFAALIPSNVLTLIQVAMTVIVGLIILVLTLPIIMSAMVKWTYPYVNDKMYQKSVAEKKKRTQPDAPKIKIMNNAFCKRPSKIRGLFWYIYCVRFDKSPKRTL